MAGRQNTHTPPRLSSLTNNGIKMIPPKPSVKRFARSQTARANRWIDSEVLPRLHHLLNTAHAKLPAVIAKGRQRFPDNVFDQWADAPELDFAQGMGTRALYLDGLPDHHFNDALEPFADTRHMHPYMTFIRRSLPELVEFLDIVDAIEELLGGIIIGDMEPVTNGNNPPAK
jgi:hypothetical protein